jgi:hypothetical protein
MEVDELESNGGSPTKDGDAPSEKEQVDNGKSQNGDDDEGEAGDDDDDDDE